MNIKELHGMREELYESMFSLAKLRQKGASNEEKTLLEAKTRSIFDNFKTPQELHYIAEHIEWKTYEEIELVFWISQNHLCSQASALMLFWRAQPLNFIEYTLGKKLISSSNTWTAIVFEILQYIMRRFTDGGYEHFGISYKPDADGYIDEKLAYVLRDDIKNAELLGKKKVVQWEVPPIMTQAV